VPEAAGQWREKLVEPRLIGASLSQGPGPFSVHRQAKGE
jgi:hypothetical protein